MSASPTPKKPQSRLGRLLDSLAARLGKSSRVFVAGLLVACLVEVVVDWNATLYEINILRDSLKQRGENYVDILRKASENALLAYDWDELDRLSQRLFDDDEVVYVRFTDALGNTLYDHLRAGWGRDFERQHQRKFRDHYRHVMERDSGGLLRDPVGLAQRMSASRHRDLLQILSDAQQRLLATVSTQDEDHEVPRTLYQDRLADEQHRIDRSLSYALGAIVGDTDEPVGVVLIAFRNDPLNQAIRGKLWKGLAISVFFLGLILVQNLMSRRAKLRLLELEAAQGAARAAVRSSLPEVPSLAWGDLGVALVQADRLGGTVYDLAVLDDGALEALVASPEGSGVDAAFASVVLRDIHRRRRAAAPADAALEELVAGLLREYETAPLGRPVELLLLRAHPDGAVAGVAAGMAPPWVVGADGAARPSEVGEALALAAPRLGGAARPFRLTLAPGERLVFFDDGLPAAAAHAFDADGAARHAAAAAPDQTAAAVAERLTVEARRHTRGKLADDLCAVVLSRRV